MEDRLDYYRKLINDKPIYAKAHSSHDNSGLYSLVMIPVLIEFVTWVIEEARSLQIERLYFLARDGYQMYLVARDYCQKMSIDIDIRYLSVSRYAMRVPEYALLGEKSLDRIFIGGIDVSLRRILKRTALTEAEIEDVAESAGMGDDLDRILNYQEIMSLKEKFRTQAKLMECIRRHSIEAYPKAMGYLKQEGLLDPVPYGLVDSGWVGTLQQTIRHLTKKARIDGFYFGLYEMPKTEDPDMYHGYYFDPGRGLDRKTYFSNCLFEAVFTSPEGMTVAYEKKDGRYAPVTDMEQNANEDTIRDNIRQLISYLDEIDKYESHSDSSLVEKILEKLMANPTGMEVEEFGDLLFSDDVLEGNLKKVAADLTGEEIANQRFLPKALIMLGLSKKEIHESAWIEGSIVRLGENVDKRLRSARRYKRFVYMRKSIQMRTK